MWPMPGGSIQSDPPDPGAMDFAPYMLTLLASPAALALLEFLGVTFGFMENKLVV